MRMSDRRAATRGMESCGIDDSVARMAFAIEIRIVYQWTISDLYAVHPAHLRVAVAEG
jgi:hypothetical protein